MMSPDALPLVPYPSSVERGEGVLFLDSARIAGDPATAGLLRTDLAARMGRSLEDADGEAAGDIVLTIDPAVGVAEGYRLTVDHRVRIAGHDAAGLFYGTRTLLQLLHQTSGGWAVPVVEIADAPRFGYRGVMLDVARHFFCVEDVERYIERVVALKYNTLHLHLTDDQGWRIQIDSRPLLTELGASTSVDGHPGGFYSKDDYRRIVDHAAARHMVVVPEIDLPGHTHAVGVAYPDLVEEPVMSQEALEVSARLRQAHPVRGEPYEGRTVGHSSVRIRHEPTYAFVRDVLTELAAMTPGPYLHIGGDECLATNPADFAMFFDRVSRIVRETGKIPVAWHEAGAVDALAEGSIGQYWGSTDPQGTHAEEALHFATHGGGLIMSPSNAAYLDMKYHANYPLGLTWAGLVDLRTAYSWEPTAVIDGVPATAILGVEAPLWTETVRSLADVDRLVFPRAAAVAEIAWSAPASASGERTWESFRRRVAGLAPGWRSVGIGYHATKEIEWTAA